LENMPENQVPLYGHNGSHLDQYHREVQQMMDTAYQSARGQGQQAAREAAREVMRNIRNQIENGQLRPNNHNVQIKK